MRAYYVDLRVLGLIGVAGFVAAAVWICFRPVHCLHIRNVNTNQTVVSVPAEPGDNLWIVFINSVEKLPVADHFVVNNKYRIVFTETVYMAPYAGYLQDERAEDVAPGTTRIAGYDREMDEVTFFAGDISRHMLFWNGRFIHLYDAVNGGDLVEIRMQTETMVDRLGQKEHIP